MVRPERTKPPYTLFYGEDAKYAQSLRIFGEMAVIAIHEGKKIRVSMQENKLSSSWMKKIVQYKMKCILKT